MYNTQYFNASCFKKNPNTFAHDPVEAEITEGEEMVLERKLRTPEQEKISIVGVPNRDAKPVETLTPETESGTQVCDIAKSRTTVPSTDVATASTSNSSGQ